jgi:hypothetical protein
MLYACGANRGLVSGSGVGKVFPSEFRHGCHVPSFPGAFYLVVVRDCGFGCGWFCGLLVSIIIIT